MPAPMCDTVCHWSVMHPRTPRFAGAGPVGAGRTGTQVLRFCDGCRRACRATFLPSEALPPSRSCPPPRTDRAPPSWPLENTLRVRCRRSMRPSVPNELQQVLSSHAIVVDAALVGQRRAVRLGTALLTHQRIERRRQLSLELVFERADERPPDPIKKVAAEAAADVDVTAVEVEDVDALVVEVEAGELWLWR